MITGHVGVKANCLRAAVYASYGASADTAVARQLMTGLFHSRANVMTAHVL